MTGAEVAANDGRIVALWRRAWGRAVSYRPLLAESFAAALPAWLLLRVVMLATAIHFGAGTTEIMPTNAPMTGPWQWLFCWDGAWYRQIAQYGYAPTGQWGVRFFPLLPLTARYVSVLTRLPVALALVLVTSVCALLFAMALYVLVVREFGNIVAARRAAWLIQLVPGAFVLAMPYTESLTGLLAVLFFLGIRRRKHTLGVLTGLGSGLVRPTGVLLALAGLVEVYRAVRERRGAREIAGASAAALSPAVGLGIYLAWCQHVFGQAMLPYTIQEKAGLRGGIATNPLPYLFHNVPGEFDWQFQAPLFVIAVAMLWLVFRRLPFSYTVWTAAGMLAAFTAREFFSAERYLAGLFPLVMVGGLVTVPWRRFAWVLAACLPLTYYLFWLALSGYLVP